MEEDQVKEESMAEAEKPMPEKKESKPEMTDSKSYKGKDDEEVKEDKPEESKGKKMEMDSIVTAMLGANAAKGDGAGKAGWGLGGLVLGSLLNNNGNGLFGGGNNSERAAVTDALIQGTANATQVQGLNSSYALSTQGYQQTAAIESKLCGISHQIDMTSAAGIQATKDAACAGIQATKDGTAAVLAAMQAQENANLREQLLLCKMKDQQHPDIININQSINTLAGAVSQMMQQVQILAA